MTNKINPASVHTPQGFRRLKKTERLREGDMYLQIISLKWQKVDDLGFGFISRTNNFTNCIRPIRLIPRYCSYNDLLCCGISIL
jgi:hypothetical protein